MKFEFRLPDIGEGVAEGEVVRWFVSVGSPIREDAPLVSVLTDKANVEIPSPKSGQVLSIHAQVGDKVKVGGLLVTIETEGTAGPAPASSPATSAINAPPSTPPRRRSVQRTWRPHPPLPSWPHRSCGGARPSLVWT